jgi:hypothetical protein
MPEFKVEQLRGDVLGQVAALQRSCFPAPFPEDLLWNETHLKRHLEVFPRGQWIATNGREVIGSATTTLISEANWDRHGDWNSTVGGHCQETFDEQGTTLYGVDVSVHPDWRGKGVGRAHYLARFELVSEWDLLRYGTACRIPDWLSWSERSGASSHESRMAYCREVEVGTVIDRTLTPLLKYGLQFVDIIENYMEDEESGNAAALLEWRPLAR